MKTEVKTALLAAIGVAVVLLGGGACDGGSQPDNATLEVSSGKSPNASVRGTVTYRERLALTPGAKLVVELRDVSYADAAAPLIARQTISGPGQVPIEFRVGYNRDDIDSRNVYSISARVIESDGRLAFTNDTAYEVITRGNPSKVDMVLVLVQPPPDMAGDAGSDWRTWVETPVQVIWANLIPNEPEHLIRVAYYQSTIEGCARPGSQGLEVDGNDIVGARDVDAAPADALGDSLPRGDRRARRRGGGPDRPSSPARCIRIIVNDRVTAARSLCQRPRVLGTRSSRSRPSRPPSSSISDGTPATEYALRVVSGLPKGSSCSWSNGYEIRREGGRTG